MSLDSRRLKIVPFSGTDYSLGEELAEPDGTRSTDQVSISNKLSLFLQWKALSAVTIELPLADNKIAFCKLSHDEDEMEPTELLVTLNDRTLTPHLKTLKIAIIKVELFQTCFEFQASVLAVRQDGEETAWDLVLSVPEAVTTFKQRRLSRIKVSAKDRNRLPMVSWELGDQSARPLELEVLELGLDSVSVRPRPDIAPGPCTICFGDLKINADLVRPNHNNLVFRFKWTAPKEFGHFFDVYRTIAFPELLPRSPEIHNAVYDLYSETGYLSAFASGDPVEARKSLLETWDRLFSARHEDTADYVVAEPDGRLCGASSLTKAFRRNGIDLWAFHQLCSRKSPSTLESSGHLYTWRAEYLAGRPENLEAIVWFKSTSRWLERIYVKFSKQCKNGSTLRLVRQFKVHVTNEGAKDVPGFELDTLKKIDRSVASVEGFFGGVGPNLLNAAGILNGVVRDGSIRRDVSHLEVARNLLASKSISEQTFYFTFGAEENVEYPKSSQLPGDRLCVITKADLLDFIASVEHSIAVTTRKLG